MTAEPERRDTCPYCGGPTTENPASPHPYCPTCFRYIVPDPDLREHEKPQSGGPPATPSAPVGIKVVCSLWTVGSFVSIGLGILLLQAALQVDYPLFVGLGILQIAVGALQLASVYGLWHLRLWGWRTAIVLLWIGLVSAAFMLMTGDIVALLPIATSVAFLVYFYRKRDLYS
ncbi:MAG: hypothetical protein JSW65_02300 [Candidatus Bipolaricaulota bacterium]|nr:MAG: hypothetical protein JSW65_02300 [Candidatus Bipolaricaulota bacterium]